MKNIRVTKIFNFETAHALKGYDGLCRNVHGHSYELMVTVIGVPNSDKNSPKLGMVMDFGDLKSIVRSCIVDKIDHALVLNREAWTNNEFGELEFMGKILLVDYQPTSENMLLDFVERIKPMLPAGISLHHLLLRETANSYAEWWADDNID